MVFDRLCGVNSMDGLHQIRAHDIIFVFVEAIGTEEYFVQRTVILGRYLLLWLKNFFVDTFLHDFLNLDAPHVLTEVRLDC